MLTKFHPSRSRNTDKASSMLHQLSKTSLLLAGILAAMTDSIAHSKMLRAVERELQGHGVIIQNLIDSRNDIRQTIVQGDDGVVRTRMWSDQAQVTNWIQQHVAQMLQRVEDNQLVRPWDPLFVALFKNKDEILTNVTDTVNGVSVELEGIT